MPNPVDHQRAVLEDAAPTDLNPAAQALVESLWSAGIDALPDARGFSRGACTQALNMVHAHAVTLGDPEHPLMVASRLLAMVVLANGEKGAS